MVLANGCSCKPLQLARLPWPDRIAFSVRGQGGWGLKTSTRGFPRGGRVGIYQRKHAFPLRRLLSGGEAHGRVQQICVSCLACNGVSVVIVHPVGTLSFRERYDRSNIKHGCMDAIFSSCHLLTTLSMFHLFQHLIQHKRTIDGYVNATANPSQRDVHAPFPPCETINQFKSKTAT